MVSTPECQQAKGIRTLHPGGFVKAKTFPAYRINAILYRNYVQRYGLESVLDLNLRLHIQVTFWLLFFPIFTYLSGEHYKQVFDVIFREQAVSEMAER